jgi:hypothetical protein
MTRLVPIPPESTRILSSEKNKEWGYQFVSVTLKDGRYFEPAVASEGHIIAVKGYKDVPFAADDVAFAVGTDKHWNFRRKKLDWPN